MSVIYQRTIPHTTGHQLLVMLLDRHGYYRSFLASVIGSCHAESSTKWAELHLLCPQTMPHFCHRFSMGGVQLTTAQNSYVIAMSFVSPPGIFLGDFLYLHVQQNRHLQEPLALALHQCASGQNGKGQNEAIHDLIG